MGRREARNARGVGSNSTLIPEIGSDVGVRAQLRSTAFRVPFPTLPPTSQTAPQGPFCTPRRKARRRVAPQVDSAQCRPHEPNAAGAELNRTRRIWPKCQRRPTNALEVSRTHVYVVGA